MNIKNIVKMGCVIEQTNMSELSTKVGLHKSTLSSKLSRGDMKLSAAIELMKALGAKVVVVYKNGQKTELE